MPKGNRTHKRLDSVARKLNRKWINEKLGQGLTLVETVRLAQEKGISEETVYKVGRERKIRGSRVNDGAIIPVQSGPSIKVEIERLPETTEELEAFLERKHNAPSAVARRYLDLEQLASTGVGLARMQAIEAQERLAEEYGRPKNVTEEIELVVYPEED